MARFTPRGAETFPIRPGAAGKCQAGTLDFLKTAVYMAVATMRRRSMVPMQIAKKAVVRAGMLRSQISGDLLQILEALTLRGVAVRSRVAMFANVNQSASRKCQ